MQLEYAEKEDSYLRTREVRTATEQGGTYSQGAGVYVQPGSGEIHVTTSQRGMPRRTTRTTAPRRYSYGAGRYVQPGSRDALTATSPLSFSEPLQRKALSWRFGGKKTKEQDFTFSE